VAASAGPGSAVATGSATVARCDTIAAKTAKNATITSAQAAAPSRMASSSPYFATATVTELIILTRQSQGKSRLWRNSRPNFRSLVKSFAPTRERAGQRERARLVDPAGNGARHHIGGFGSKCGQAAQRVGQGLAAGRGREHDVAIEGGMHRI